ncbi:putative receptor-like protein kinase [Morus notabilis]|uniref:Putative receptor-like protein kinase n=1 Tax=Morus notabilis TaxID=981085 RepID=W9SGP1_9ROSA|nr:rust resistance kinase Lr10 [Morus notabilis]EXC31506.1 putative receptor-like protein kinase [Morus notabilis]
MSSLCLLFLLLAFFTDLGAAQDQCKQIRCGKNGPAIRFPFRLKDRHQDHCGFRGFELSCRGKSTVLELQTTPVKFFVKSIDYKSQVIQLYDPDDCLLGKLLKINGLSISPFGVSNDLRDYALFNCSVIDRHKLHGRGQIFPCLGGGYGRQIVVVNSLYAIEEVPLTGCTKMYNISSVGYVLYDIDRKHLYLNWTRPNCSRCEEMGNGCRVKINGTRDETECFMYPKSSKGKTTKIVATGVTLGTAVLTLLLVVTYRSYSSNKQEKENQRRIERFLEDYKALKPSRYSYADIKHITSQFKDKLGEGAFGTVFKGKLSNDFFVAVKILNNSKENGEDFINEVGTIGRIHHVNVVRLVGYCADGFRRALVYEFLPNGSLQRYISSPDTDHFLGWKNLQDIALGIAKGIEYLHQGCDQRILHFDIKPHNVLLDHNFTPKVSDFGLAKLCTKDQSIVSMTTARGTMGYIAPEVFSRNFGNVSYKSDVYSFGMLLLEMVGGRKITDVTEDNTSQVYYPEWIYNLLEEGEDLRIHIGEEGDCVIAKKLAIVGLWCIKWHPVDRPSMKVVVHMLEGGEKLSMPPNPFASAGPTKTIATLPGRRMKIELEAIAELD